MLLRAIVFVIAVAAGSALYALPYMSIDETAPKGSVTTAAAG